MTTEEMGGMHLEADIIIPSQFLPRTVATPEKRLMLAVLEEAIGTLQRYVVATDRHGRAMFVDVEAWFASEDVAPLFSFIGICDALGIDATYVRSGLGRWLDTQRTGSLGPARPIYRFPFRRVNGMRHRTYGRSQATPKRGQDRHKRAG
jgi:hypothetical protein